MPSADMISEMRQMRHRFQCSFCPIPLLPLRAKTAVKRWKEKKSKSMTAVTESEQSMFELLIRKPLRDPREEYADPAISPSHMS